MKRPYIGKLHLNPYGSTLFVYLDQEAFAKARGVDQECVKSCGGMTTYTDDHNEFHVLIFHNSIDVLAHEMLHVVINLLRHRGVILSSKSEETYTYLMGWLTNEVYGMICRHYDKQDKKRQATSDATTEAASGAKGEGVKPEEIPTAHPEPIGDGARPQRK